MTACRVFFPTKVDLHVENAELLMKNFFGHKTDDSHGESAASSPKHVQSKEVSRTRRKTDDGHREGKDECLSSSGSYLQQARAMVRSLLML